MDSDGETVSFECDDTGTGMSPEQLVTALTPFGQVDTSYSRQSNGTGLGLPLTKRFVELIGGEFAIQSEQGIGTTVRFTLPVCRDDSPLTLDPVVTMTS